MRRRSQSASTEDIDVGNRIEVDVFESADLSKLNNYRDLGNLLRKELIGGCQSTKETIGSPAMDRSGFVDAVSPELRKSNSSHHSYIFGELERCRDQWSGESYGRPQ